MPSSFAEPFVLTLARPGDVTVIAGLARDHGEDRVLLRPRPSLEAAARRDRAWKIVDHDGQLVASTFLFPLGAGLEEVAELDGDGALEGGIAAYEMAHMTVHSAARGLDFGVLLHGVRVLWMLEERLTAPPLWLVMFDNATSVRLVTQIGAEPVPALPPALAAGLRQRAEKVLARRAAPGVPASLTDVVKTMTIPAHGLSRTLRETAGALALLGARLTVAPPLDHWFNLSRFRELRAGARVLPWAHSPLYRALWGST
ncbi:MAG TPA: hypothetical protein VGD07_03585 [Methylomirabilota bacterium]